MFKFQRALRPWNGRDFTITELQTQLSELRLEHLGEIAPEIGVRELLSLALERKWVIEQPNGKLQVQVPEPALK
jgi:hypothetical protein